MKKGFWSGESTFQRYYSKGGFPLPWIGSAQIGLDRIFDPRMRRMVNFAIHLDPKRSEEKLKNFNFLLDRLGSIDLIVFQTSQDQLFFKMAVKSVETSFEFYVFCYHL